jgi:hypothetical protein
MVLTQIHSFATKKFISLFTTVVTANAVEGSRNGRLSKVSYQRSKLDALQSVWHVLLFQLQAQRRIQ